MTGQLPNSISRGDVPDHDQPAVMAGEDCEPSGENVNDSRLRRPVSSDGDVSPDPPV